MENENTVQAEVNPNTNLETTESVDPNLAATQHAEVMAQNPAATAATGAVLALYGAIVLVLVASLWKVFTKAGQSGWKSLIPVYNMWLFNRIAGVHGIHFFLAFIPFVNLISMLYTNNSLSKRFGHSFAFAAGLTLLPLVFFPILAFGKSEFQRSSPPPVPQQFKQAA